MNVVQLQCLATRRDSKHYCIVTTFIIMLGLCRLAQQLMHRAEDRLQIYLQRLLSSIILGNDVDSELVDDFPSLVHEV